MGTSALKSTNLSSILLLFFALLAPALFPTGQQIVHAVTCTTCKISPTPTPKPSPSPTPTPTPKPNPVSATGAPQNQRGLGALSSPAIRAGGALNVMGSQSFTYAVPLFSLPGRHGLNLNLALVYNSLLWEGFGNSVMFSPDNSTVQDFFGFRLDLGNIIWSDPGTGPSTVTGVLIEPSGTKHALVYSGAGNVYNTSDSSYINVQHNVTSSTSTAQDIVTYKNGRQVFYKFALVDALGSVITTQPTKIEDTTGNFISITYTGGWQFAAPSVSTITDTVGRTISFFYTVVDSSGDLQLNCVTDGTSCTAAGARTFTFSYNTNYILNYNFSNLISGVGAPPLQGSQFPYTVLSGITRPDGTHVQFNYGDWLIVNDIQELSSNNALRYETSYNFPLASAGPLSSPPTYTQQTVTTFDKDGNETPAIWNYQVATSTSSSGIPVVSCFAVIDPAGTSQTTNFPTSGLVSQSLIGTGSMSPCTAPPTTVWKTVRRAWTSDAGGANPRPSSLTTVLSDGTTQSQVQFVSYDAHGDPTDVKEFDYGSGGAGPLRREVVTTYATNLGNIFGLPTDIQVKNGSGSLVSHRKFTYDDYSTTALQSVSPLPIGFDSSNPNFGAGSTTPRGNLTGSTVYTNAAAGTGAINSTLTYDMLGNPLTSQVGASTGARTTSAYSINTEYAYPDSVSIGPSGNQLTGSFTYNMNTGAVSSATDPNGHKTQFDQDIDGRPFHSTTPDGVITTFSYDDTASNPGASVTTSAFPNAARKSVSDFLGRPLLSQDLDNSSVVSTIYHVRDLANRIVYVSNPLGPNDPAEVTTSNYDPLGRTTSLAPPDTSPYQTQYLPTTFTDASGATLSGASVTTTDPANQQRRRFFDGLGNLVKVDEPGGSGFTTFASGSLTINGALQSWSATQTATSGHVELTFSGSLLSRSACSSGQPCSDSGTISVSVNTPQKGFTYTANYSASTGTDSTVPVQAIANAINLDSTSPVTAKYFGLDEFGNVVMDLFAKATGAASNYGLATSIVSNDPTDFPNHSFTLNAGPSLIGGRDASKTSTSGTAYLSFSCTIAGTPCSAIDPNQSTDTGTITVSITDPSGSTFSQSATYTTAPGTDPIQAIQALAQSIQTNGSSPVNAFSTTDESGNYVLYLAARATGSGTNYPLSVSVVSSVLPSPSYQVSAPGALAGGQTGTNNSTVFDSGVVYLAVGPFIASAPYSQSGNNTAALVAAALVNGPDGLNQASLPVHATVSGSTISLTYKIPGSAGNLPVNVHSSTESPDNPSFTSLGTALSGGVDAAPPSLSTPNSTFYSYDALGNLLKVTEGQQVRTYTYDGLSRQTSSCIPETSNLCTGFTYTDFGAVKTQTDPRNIVTTYGFDAWNHVNDITYNDGKTPEVKFTYGGPGASNNGAGRLVSSSVVNGTTKTNQYDVMGNVTQVTQTIGTTTFTTKYGYTGGELSSITYPSASASTSGTTVSYGRDDLGRVTSVTANGTTVYSVNSYNAAGTPLTTSYGNSVMTGGYGYNSRLQLSSIQYGTSTKPLIALSYSYGANGTNNGQIQAVTDTLDPTHSTVYSYDVLGRVASAGTFDEVSPVSWALQFAYDRYGNRLSQTPVSGRNTMPSAQLTIDPTTNRVVGGGIGYDNAGNMTGDGLFSYAFDGDDHITSTSGIGASTPLATYAYDAFGHRVNKNGNAYIYSGGSVIAEYANGAAAGSPSAEYIYAGGRRLATLVKGAFIYHYWDHLSNRLSTDANGNLLRGYGSFPFGETWYESGTADKWKFTTYENDSESGLNYADARFHSPRLGRFMSLDPLSGNIGNPQSLHRYTYAANDPIRFTDRTGMVLDGCDPVDYNCANAAGDPFREPDSFYGDFAHGGGLDNGGIGEIGICDGSICGDPALDFGDGFADGGDGLINCSTDNPSPDARCGAHRANTPDKEPDEPDEVVDVYGGPLPQIDPIVLPQGPLPMRLIPLNTGSLERPCGFWESFFQYSKTPCANTEPIWFTHLGKWMASPGYQAAVGTDPAICGSGEGEAMHDPRESQNGVLGNGGKYRPGTGKGRGVNKEYEGTVNHTSDPEAGNAAGNGAALVGNAVNCYVNASQ
jgi:RHS repeat-associated protein